MRTTNKWSNSEGENIRRRQVGNTVQIGEGGYQWLVGRTTRDMNDGGRLYSTTSTTSLLWEPFNLNTSRCTDTPDISALLRELLGEEFCLLAGLPFGAFFWRVTREFRFPECLPKGIGHDRGVRS